MAASQGDIRRYEQERAAARPLGTEPLPAPSGGFGLGPRLPEIHTTSPAMNDAVGGILQGQKDLNASIASSQPIIDQRRAALQGELDQPLPQRPALNPIPQFQPREVSTEDMTLFAGVAMALAGLGTKALRGNTAMALNAAAGAMKGFNEGNLTQARLDIENFKRTFDSVIAENQRMSEQYRGIIEDRKLSLAQKEQALRVAAAARDDQIMLSSLKQGNLKMVFDLEAHRINAANQASLRAQQIYDAAEYRRMQLEKDNEPLVPVQRPDGTTVYVRRSEAAGQTVPPRNAGDKLTEAEAKGTLFWRQMKSAEEAATAVTKNFDVSKMGSQVQARMAGSDLTNWATSGDAQKYAQAAEQWAEAYLRLKTGAATNRDEIKRNARAYFPQPGDDAGTIAQKNDMRRRAIEDVSIVAGRGVDRQPTGAPKRIANDAEYNALPSGAVFIGPDGKQRRKP